MGYGDPFVPKSFRAPTPRRAPDLPPLVRLRQAGLTIDDEPIVQARWATLSNAERFESMEALDNLDDDELRRQIEEMREEAAAGEALAEYPGTEADPVGHPEAAAAETKPKRRGRPRKGERG